MRSHGKVFSGSIRIVSLALGALAGCDGGEAEPQPQAQEATETVASNLTLPPNLPNPTPSKKCQPSTDTTIAAALLAGFTPQPFVDSPGGKMELYAVTTRGVSVARFYDKDWHSWRSYGYDATLPTPGPVSTPQTRGWDAGVTVLPRIGGRRDVFFGYTDGVTASIARNSIDLTATGTMAMSIMSPPAPYMSTVTGAVLGGVEHLFGNVEPNSAVLSSDVLGERLIEQRSTDGTSKQLPRVGTSPQQYVGPGGVLSLRRNPAVDSSDSLYLFASDGLQDIQDHPGGFAVLPVFNDIAMMKVGDNSWTSLGVPRAVTRNGSGPLAPAFVRGGPFAFGFYAGDPNQGGAAWIDLFATARDSDSFQYRLFGRSIANGVLQGDWVNHGVPPTVGSDEAFDMKTAMVWWWGAKFTGVLRVNMFGTTETGKLIERFWDGHQWQWGQNVIANAPDGSTFVGVSSAVYESGSYRRLSVFARTSNGAIWERAYTFDGATTTDWTWTNLSLVYPCALFLF